MMTIFIFFGRASPLVVICLLLGKIQGFVCLGRCVFAIIAFMLGFISVMLFFFFFVLIYLTFS